MGRSIVYCPICGCPFEHVLQNNNSQGGYSPTISPPSQTEYLADFRVIGKSTFTYVLQPARSACLSSPSSLVKTHLTLLLNSSHDTETSETPFGVSPPAHVAEFRCCFIQGRDSYGSAFSCWQGKRWKLLEKSASGTVLYPLHETCIETVRRVAQHNELGSARSNTVDYTSLQGYYEALLRLHDRLTSWPYDDPDAEEQLSRFHAYPTEYGSYKLEWEHQYYGAARFADGSGWSWAPEWEWLCTDPSVVPDLTVYILSKLSPIPTLWSLESPQSIDNPSDPSPSSLAALETISTEIIHLIALHAGASASLRLRRCSKTVYSRISLTQCFWRDHLISGSLVDYLWDLDRAACIQKDAQGHWDWKALAQKLRKPYILENALARSLESQEVDNDERTTFEQRVRQGGEFSDAPMGLQNRCRLVKIIRDIESMDLIEASEPVIEEDGERVRKRRYSLLFNGKEATRV